MGTTQAPPSPHGIPLVDHLTGEAIFQRYRNTTRATERTHWQVIYLKSQGRIVTEIADVTGYSATWIRQVIHRYNDAGPDSFIRDQSADDVAYTRLKADHARKSEELDTARVAQQSMLAAPIPSHPDLDIAAYMVTATELGGDYYDFHLDGEGALTIAIGDATGHGAKAGLMVTATKSLFKALGHKPDLLRLVRQLTETLKSLNLRGLYMHLTLGRYANGLLDLVVAGMPPALVYHRKSRKVEDVVLKGMPLGSFPEFPYQRCTLELQTGDTVLLMSDGFLELLNPAGEQMGPERIRQLFSTVATESAGNIVTHLRHACTAWGGARDLSDDVTFLILQYRR